MNCTSTRSPTSGRLAKPLRGVATGTWRSTSSVPRSTNVGAVGAGVGRVHRLHPADLGEAVAGEFAPDHLAQGVVERAHAGAPVARVMKPWPGAKRCSTAIATQVAVAAPARAVLERERAGDVERRAAGHGDVHPARGLGARAGTKPPSAPARTTGTAAARRDRPARAAQPAGSRPRSTRLPWPCRWPGRRRRWWRGRGGRPAGRAGRGPSPRSPPAGRATRGR